MIISEKQLLRNQLRRAVAGLSGPARRAASEKIRRHLEDLAVFAKAGVIYGFYPTEREPDWIGVKRAEGSLLCLPRLHGRTCSYMPAADLSGLETGPFGIHQPPACAQPCPAPDIILVPGLGFDREGRRLGRGGGYMDRLLQGVRGLRVGVAFSIQVIPKVPVIAHDEPMDALITEDGFLPCFGGRGLRWD
jgi:5-formyltetrahydrofolate cyclo-ligase